MRYAVGNSVKYAAITMAVLCCGCAAPSTTVQTQPPAVKPAAAQYSLNELLVLDSIDGYGDGIQLDVNRTNVAPGNTLGFSVRFELPNNGRQYNYLPLPAAATGYDTVEFDFYKEAAADAAHVSLCLTEPNNNHWVVWDTALKDVPAGQWQHLSIPRAKIRPWKLSQIEPNWEHITRVEILPVAGHSAFLLDNLRLTGPGQKPMPIFNTHDDGLPTVAMANPMQKPMPSGLPFFTLGLGAITGESGLATPLGLRHAVGSAIGITFGASDALDFGAISHALNQQGFPTAYYSQMGANYIKYFTRRQAWDALSNGKSLNNSTPSDPDLWGRYHTIAFPHPGVLAAQQHRLDALSRAGVGTWAIADYVFPYFDFGHAPAVTKAFREDLNGTDEGAQIVDGSRQQVMRFPDYFRAYNGFYPTPAAMGLARWDEYARPLADDTNKFKTRRDILFWHLLAYEWLKLADKTGRYYRSKGGDGLWLMPNSENIWSPDYVHAVRSAGGGAIVPEWFGQAALDLEYAYASWPYLWEEARRGHARISIDMETGYNGHGAPYWDWRYAFTVAYGLTAATQAENTIIDFLDEAPYAVMSNPQHKAEYARFRDGVMKVRGFRQAYEDKARSPYFATAPILCVADRPAGRHTGTPFFNSTLYSLSYGFSRAHLPYHFRDLLNLAQVLKERNYRAVAYFPAVPRVGDFETLRDWVATGSGRVLLTHTFVPTRDARGFFHAERGNALGDANGAEVLGLGKISQTAVKNCTVTAAVGAWQNLFHVGEKLTLTEPLTASEKGHALVMTDQGPLVSEVNIGQGHVIYLHFAAPVVNDITASNNDPTVADLMTRAAQVVGQMTQVAPLCGADAQTLVQVFNVPGGRSVTAWDNPALQAVRKPNDWQLTRPMFYEAPEVNRTITLPANGGQWLTYDFWADRVTPVTPVSGTVTLRLKGSSLGLWYVGPDTPVFRGTLARAQQSRAALKSYAQTGDNIGPIPNTVSQAQLPPSVVAQTYLAREAKLEGGAFPFSDKSAPSGVPYVGAYWVPGASTTFTVRVPSAGRYNVGVRYANAGANEQAIAIIVNGTQVGMDRFPCTGDGDQAFQHWMYRVLTLALQEGSNTISISAPTFDGGPIFLDSLAVWPHQSR